MGNSASQYNIGIIYCHGYGVPKDFNESLFWLTKSADNGNIRLFHVIGAMYYDD